MNNYLLALQVWFQSLERQEIEFVKASSKVEAEGIAQRKVKLIQGWSGHRTHTVVIECNPDGKPILPIKPIKLTLKERISGKFARFKQGIRNG